MDVKFCFLREMNKETSALEIEYLRRSASAQITKISNITIRNKIQAEQSVADRIRRRRLKWYRYLLRMEFSRWPKKINLPVGVGRQLQSRKNQMMDFMRSIKTEEDITKDKDVYLWRLGIDRRS